MFSGYIFLGGVFRLDWGSIICKSPELCTGRKVLIIKIYTRSTPYFLYNVTFDAPVFFYSLLTKFNVVQGLSQRQRIPSVGVYNQYVKIFNLLFLFSSNYGHILVIRALLVFVWFVFFFLVFVGNPKLVHPLHVDWIQPEEEQYWIS